MQQVTLWMNTREMERMVDKIMGKLAELNVSEHLPCAGITRENCPDYILDRLKKEIESYGNQPAADLNNFNLAFVFGQPLNDTVFMLSGCYYPAASQPPTVVCDMQHNGGASESYTVDFYHHI